MAGNHLGGRRRLGSPVIKPNERCRKITGAQSLDRAPSRAPKPLDGGVRPMPSGVVFVPGYRSSSSDPWSESMPDLTFTRLRPWVRVPQRPPLRPQRSPQRPPCDVEKATGPRASGHETPGPGRAGEAAGRPGPPGTGAGGRGGRLGVG